jgi:uroporphyrinogen decarboxylase
VTHRERLVAALRRQTPDRLPWSLALTPPVVEVFRRQTGADNYREFWDFDYRDVPLTAAAMAPLPHAAYYAGRRFAGPVEFDPEWGYARVEQERGSHFRHFESPFAGRPFTADDARRYPLPDYPHPALYGDVATANAAWHARGYATRHLVDLCTFDASWLIRGYEDFLADLAAEEEAVLVLMDRVSDAVASRLAQMAARGTDLVGFGEDVGMQATMILHPDAWRKHIKPRFRKIVRAVKTARPEALFFYHSDGAIGPIVPDLIEMGVDVLNPLQPECIDPFEVKRAFGDRVALWGAIGTQTVMPFGTPAEVRGAVHRAFDQLGTGGGYVCAPSHDLEPEVPWENIEAFVAACRECVGQGGAA